VPDLTPADWDEMFKDEPGPPTAWDEYFQELIREFAWTARQPPMDIPWHLDMTVSIFCRKGRDTIGVRQAIEGADVLDRDAATDLMHELVRTYVGASLGYPKDFNREILMYGFNALQALVLIWAETPAKRAERDRRDICDLWTYVRMLQNEMWTADLKREIAGREDDRRKERNDAVVTDLKRMAGAA